MDGRRSRQLALSFLVLTLCGLTAVRGIAPARADDVRDFRQAQEEYGDSRVYSRTHFRNSTVAGIIQGEHIGRQAFAQYLQPYRP